ncbi:MAG: hypothetical protein KDC34_20205 [Saprospiraceae bacterium]|nr:hypothetical protein [Saprospiraceae bacterium]
MYKFSLLLSSFILFSGCTAQNGVENKSLVLNDQNKADSIGRIVTETDARVLVIFQDKNGHYWFGGGDQGVYRYDGKSLVLYTKEDGLCSTGILGIQEDKLGNIFFDTSEGVCKFDGQGFTTLEIINNNVSPNEWKLEPDDLWFRIGWDNKGPFRYDGQFLYQLEFPKTDQEDIFYSAYPNVSYNPYGIYSYYKDSKGSVWFGTSSLGVCRFDGESVRWLYEKHLTDTPSGGSFGIRSIIEDADGYFWFCNTRYRYEILPDSPDTAGAGLINYRKESGVAISEANMDADFPYFMSIVEDDAGDLWMATYEEGVWRNTGKELIHYPVKDGETDVLLFSIFKDNQGVLWLGSHNAGAFKFDGNKFKKFKA